MQRFDPELDAALPEGSACCRTSPRTWTRVSACAVRMANQVLEGVGGWWTEARDAIGVVLGLDGKTELALRVNQRIYLDLVTARLRESPNVASGPA